MRITSKDLESTGRRFSREMVHSLLSGKEFAVHFSRLATNGESPAELEAKVRNAIKYQALKGKSGPEIREYLSILEETGKCWEVTANAKTQEILVQEVKA